MNGIEGISNEGTGGQKFFLNGKRFLVVDDDPINQKIICDAIHIAGGVTAIANNGKEAVDQLAVNSNYDLIITDVQMPVMGGYEAVGYIRQQLGLQIPVIIITATPNEDDVGKCRELGANDFIVKPFNIDHLYKRILRIFYAKAEYGFETATVKERAVKLYDLSSLEDLGDKASILEVLELFLEHTPKQLKELTDAVVQKNWDSVSRLAHKLKGPMGVLQSYQLLTLFDEIETGAKGEADEMVINEQLIRVNDLFFRLKLQLQKEQAVIRKEMESM